MKIAFLIRFITFLTIFKRVACGCECILTTPSKIPISSLGSFANTCYKSWKNRLDSCTCEERVESCVSRCFQLANLPRDSATNRYWKRWTCQADRKIYSPPGQPLLSYSHLNEENCRVSDYQLLFNKLACCRRGYGYFIFDERCVWRNYLWE